MLAVMLSLAAPVALTHQGRLIDATGDPLSGPHTLQFQLFDAAAAGTSLYDSGPMSLVLEQGYYSVSLGPLSEHAQAAEQMWMSIAVDSVVLGARQAIGAVPYAMTAHTPPPAVSWQALTDIPPGFVDGVDNTVNEAQVDQWVENNGYLRGVSAGGHTHTVNTGHGGPWGSWSGWRFCPSTTYVCGMRIKVEGSQGGSDDTAMNDIQLACCTINQ